MTKRYVVHGFPACVCMKASIKLVEERLRKEGLIKRDLSGLINKGAFNPWDPYSLYTHSEGGVFDLNAVLGNSKALKIMRECGWAAWRRTKAQIGSEEHVHAVLDGCPHQHSSTRSQVDSYRAGRNALKNNGPDDGPRISPMPTWQQAVRDKWSPKAKKLAKPQVWVAKKKVAWREGPSVAWPKSGTKPVGYRVEAVATANGYLLNAYGNWWPKTSFKKVKA
ncbi:MAG: hypothetical protein LBT54_04315 [Bifidobacteriaceae bacterium]|nr:hypothetical protein [Bifidobacteriaceae bacterium]